MESEHWISVLQESKNLYAKIHNCI